MVVCGIPFPYAFCKARLFYGYVLKDGWSVSLHVSPSGVVMRLQIFGALL